MDVPRVRVRGTITAAEDLTEATANGVKLAKFPGKGKKFAIDQELPLQPGAHEITFVASSASGTS